MLIDRLIDLIPFRDFRRAGKITLWLLVKGPPVIAASADALIHCNLGRRHMLKVWTSIFVCLCFGLFAPPTQPLIHVFSFGLLLRTFQQFSYNRFRRLHGLPEPHSGSTGVPFAFWSRIGVAPSITLNVIEPALCIVSGLVVVRFDPFFATWLIGAGSSLVLRGILNRFTLGNRVDDMLDSRLESEQLRSAMERDPNEQQSRENQPHHAHLPNFGNSHRKWRSR
jgi:hypothetical protein